LDRIKLLDHGYLQLVESWGSDERIIEAARMSTDKGFKGWGGKCNCLDAQSLETTVNCKLCSGSGWKVGDEKLLRFLWEHKHYTPFEMAGLTIEVQAPIFVFREWQRHRTQSYNELSGRYTELLPFAYVPSIERLMNAKQGVKNKQGSEKGLSEQAVIDAHWHITSCYEVAWNSYKEMLIRGVSREIARLVLPVAQYSRMRASANLRNWLGFLTLRMEQGAQWEIRQYANALADVISKLFPRTYELFQEG